MLNEVNKVLSVGYIDYGVSLQKRGFSKIPTVLVEIDDVQVIDGMRQTLWLNGFMSEEHETKEGKLWVTGMRYDKSLADRGYITIDPYTCNPTLISYAWPGGYTIVYYIDQDGSGELYQACVGCANMCAFGDPSEANNYFNEDSRVVGAEYGPEGLVECEWCWACINPGVQGGEQDFEYPLLQHVLVQSHNGDLIAATHIKIVCTDFGDQITTALGVMELYNAPNMCDWWGVTVIHNPDYKPTPAPANWPDLVDWSSGPEFALMLPKAYLPKTPNNVI